MAKGSQANTAETNFDELSVKMVIGKYMALCERIEKPKAFGLMRAAVMNFLFPDDELMKTPLSVLKTEHILEFQRRALSTPLGLKAIEEKEKKTNKDVASQFIPKMLTMALNILEKATRMVEGYEPPVVKKLYEPKSTNKSTPEFDFGEYEREFDAIAPGKMKVVQKETKEEPTD